MASDCGHPGKAVAVADEALELVLALVLETVVRLVLVSVGVKRTAPHLAAFGRPIPIEDFRKQDVLSPGSHDKATHDSVSAH